MTQLEHRSVVHLRSRSWLILSACLVGSLLAVFASKVGWYTTDTSTGSPSVESSRVQASLAKIPLSFIDNAGQSDPQVRFQVKGAGHTIFFTQKEVVFSASREAEDDSLVVSSVVRLRFDGANLAPSVEGIEQLPGVANFFIGNDPSRWRSGVATYGGVAYRELYPGVDLVYRGSDGQLKSEFVVSPGVDPKVITLEYSGMENMWIRGDGALVLKTKLGELVEEAPVVYQEIGGARVSVEGRYVLRGNDRVGFELGVYDKSTPLVIDPTLVYSTYLGGSGFDVGSGIAVDDSDNAYVTGQTDSFDFPTQPPIQDTFGGDGNAFVSKLNASGTALVYSTYLGGSVGDGGSGIAVDDSGNAYVTGDTESWDFPTKNPIQRSNAGNEDAFVAKITELELANDLVTFEPDPNTFSTDDDTTGCPSDYVGKFNFGAMLTNISQSMLPDLHIKVAEISNGNLLLTRPLTRSRDQGRLFSTDGNLQLGTEEWSQSITTGISGQLAEIQIQFHYGIPTPTPTLRLSIFDGGNPISGSALFSEQLTLTSANVFTWDVSSANLFFDVGDVFSFVLQADASGYEIAGNDPPGYDGGELFRNRLAFPELSDIAFITYMKPKSGVTIGAGDVFPVPKENGYSDGQLSPGEFVDVPFVVCLRTKRSFRLIVNVLGLISNINNASQIGQPAHLSTQTATPEVGEPSQRSETAQKSEQPIDLGRFSP